MAPGPTPPKQQYPEPRDGFVAVGYVHAVHGIRGELSVEPLTELGTRFEPGARLWAAGVQHTVAGARAHRGRLLIELEGVTSRTNAERFARTLLEIPQAELPQLEPGAYYRHQIVGLIVVDEHGTVLGTVDSVLETGANDVYVVRDNETELLLPAIDSVIVDVDLAANRMVVHVLDGLERRPLQSKKKRPKP